jgi:methionine-S-sulfoxide reductase
MHVFSASIVLVVAAVSTIIVSVSPFSPAHHGGKKHTNNHASAIEVTSSTSIFAGKATDELPAASLVGYVAQEERPLLEQALKSVGFRIIDPLVSTEASVPPIKYSFSKATGMLQLVPDPSSRKHGTDEPPRWIPLVKNMENILVANGWSFLDPDENDPLSAFDIDAANLEGQYQPKWGVSSQMQEVDHQSLSDLGFSLQQLSRDQIVEASQALRSDLTRQVLLEGATDPPNVKKTHNEFDFSGSVRDVPTGVFVCAIGGLPLFTTRDLSPTTASSGWLSFGEPVSKEHIQLIHPPADAQDQRIEVVCAKTGCHLGHYFGRGIGYCINAAALDFLPADAANPAKFQTPASWFAMEEQSPFLHSVLRRLTTTYTLVFGAGCFWHVEYALRRLPGVLSTKVGYAGGNQVCPTYEGVCQGDSGHAEVVLVEFDPDILDPRILTDCFLTLHDPTKVRAHGKHAQRVGQYRSCIFAFSDKVLSIAQMSVNGCKTQLNRELSTEIRQIEIFWPAEERHQQHEKQRRLDIVVSTLSVNQWLQLYGRRQETVWGSGETLNEL